ncbi:tetratricopeptide repeat protein [Pantoea stewartii]|uniref:tetratricopeptide repeat protein n=1 Tax=Pantoea stewartii TaxID=66269 RepID=UPI00345BF132
MDLNSYAASIPLEYLILRHYVLHFLDDKALTVHDRNFLYPLENIDRTELSLTDKMDPDNQIRYFLADRTLKKVSEFAKKIAERGTKKVRINLIHAESVLIRHFAQALSRMKVETAFEEFSEQKSQNELTQNEKKLITQLIRGYSGDEHFVIGSIKKIVNCGDVFSAEYLLEHGLKYFKSFETANANLIGTIKNCVNKPIEAEYYYLKIKEQNDPLALVVANYPLSMLYLRHHKQEKRNLEKGKYYLTEAYDYIQNGGLDSLSKEDREFYTVFNRNGYGLILFREGKVSEAISLLNWGIETLSSDTPKHHMHRSVILYNVCQCYKKIRDFDSAINCYKQLLEIDYVFPEYHLEMGLCLLEKGDLSAYEKCLKEALRLNPYHSDSHYYYSLFLADRENYELAETHAELAWQLTGDDITAYNYAYMQSQRSCYNNLHMMQPKRDLHIFPEWIVLKAESDSHQSLEAAANTLRAGIDIFPASSELKLNLAKIENDHEHA